MTGMVMCARTPFFLTTNREPIPRMTLSGTVASFGDMFGAKTNKSPNLLISASTSSN
eukprot:COSAG05_NODE_11_length_38500_cov_831.349861_25_plen_57_part_00